MHFSLFILLGTISTALAYSAGAPEATCDDMTPKHPFDPQSSPFPYKISLGKAQIKPNEVVDVTLAGPKPFKGFLLQVREGDKAVGEFLIDGNDRLAKTINCHGNKASAATHKNSTSKDKITLKWKAPGNPGKFTVYATVAEDGSVFWARKPTEIIAVS